MMTMKPAMLTACLAGFLTMGTMPLLGQVSTLSTGGAVTKEEDTENAAGVISKTSNLVYLPVATSAAESDSLFGSQGFEAVSTVGLSFSGGDGAFYSEFLSDNLVVVLPLGYGRMGFGAFVQSKDVESDSTDEGEENLATESAVERFVGAGGNAIFYYALPLVAYEAGFNDRPTSMRAQVMLLPRLGLDLPALNAGTGEASGNLDLGATLNLQLMSDKSVFNIFSSIRGGWVPMASQDFYERLGRDAGFAYVSIEGGVVLSQLIRIGVRGALSGPRTLVNAAPLSVSVQLLPLQR